MIQRNARTLLEAEIQNNPSPLAKKGKRKFRRLRAHIQLTSELSGIAKDFSTK